MTKPTISIETIGCKVNFAETERLKTIFKDAGYELIAIEDKPEYLLINSCSVTSKSERDCRRLINRTKRNSEDTFIVIAGCLPLYNREDLLGFDKADAFLGQKEKYLAQDILPKIKEGDLPKVNIEHKNIPFENAASTDPENRSRAFVKVQDGCNYFCTYCAVPYARGNTRSMPFEQIIPAMQTVYDRGFRETVISGINLATYEDGDKNFIDIIHKLENSDIDMRYRISSIEPNLLTEELIDFVAKSKKICPHFHIPLQAGNDIVLKDMKRRYDTDHFRKLIFSIKEKIPHAGIGIDVITGFPTETTELFENAYAFLESLPFSYLHVFSYSKRPNTLAAKMKNLVLPGEIKERTKALRELSDKKTLLFYKSQIGATLSVIGEYKNGENHALGWAENYVRVKFPMHENSNKPMIVKLKGIEKDYVIGETV